MRRMIIVGAALGLMWGLPYLTASSSSEAFDPMTLAAIGFVLLAAFAIGEFGGRLRLPKVTGYIVSGVLLGPFVLNILSQRVAGEMRVFNTLALGLIATTAGLELDLKALGKVKRTVIATIALKIPFLLLSVGGVFYLIQTFWPVLPNISSQAIIPLAVIFAVLAVGTSPAIAIAVVSENKAKGRLSDIVLSIAVAKDLVVVILLALALSYAQAMLSPSGALDPKVIIHLGQELGLSILAGAAIGVVLILYAKFLRAEPLMALLVIITIAAEVSRMFQLELLLVLIASGFVVRNFSRYEHHLLEPLNRISLPVFVVFFTTAGANVDLSATVDVAPLAFALVAARAVAYLLAGRLGGSLGKESREVRTNAWLAYLPQAGVTLGLVLLASQALPDLATPLLQTGMAVVAINLLVGPVLMSMALRRAGEVSGAAAEELALEEDEPFILCETAPSEGAVSEGVVPEDSSSVAPPLAHLGPLELEELTRQIGSRELASQLGTLQDKLLELLVPFVGEVIVPQSESGRKTIVRLLEGADEAMMTDNIVGLLSKSPPVAPVRWEEEVSAHLRRELSAVNMTPVLMTAEMRGAILRPMPGDGYSLRWRKWLLRTMRRFDIGIGRAREVPFKLVGRIALEPRLAKAAALMTSSWYRAVIAGLSQVRRAVAGHQKQEDARLLVNELFASWSSNIETDLRMAIRQGVLDMCAQLAVVGSPQLPRRRLRYSRFSTVVRDAENSIAEESAKWRKIIHAAFLTTRIAALTRQTETQLLTLTRRRIIDPLRQLEMSILVPVTRVHERIEALRMEVASGDFSADADLSRYLQVAGRIFPPEERQQLRHHLAAFRSASRKGYFSAAVSAATASYPKAAEVLPVGIRAEEALSPDRVPLSEANFAERIKLLLGEEFLKPVGQIGLHVGSHVVAVEPNLRDAIHIITYGLETAIRRKEESASVRAEYVLGSLERATSRSAQVLRDLVQALEAVHTETDRMLECLPGQLKEAVQRTQGKAEQIRTTTMGRIRSGLDSRAERVLRWTAEKWSPMAKLVGVASKSSVEEWQIQTGSRRLDAKDIASYCRRRLPSLRELDIPKVYVEGLTLDPVSDRRMLTARKPLIERLLSSITDPEDDANILIVGGRGAGKSTLTTELQFRLSERKVVRLDGALMMRGESLSAALAEELHCAADETVLGARLNELHPLIIFDDLEKAIELSSAGIAEVVNWCNLVVSTAGRVQWLVTIANEMFPSLVETGVPIEKAFGHVVRLESLDRRSLRQMIAARQRLIGIPVRVGRQLGLLDFLFNWRQSSRETQYYRTLADVSRGNMRAALLIHLRSLKRSGDTLVAQEPRRFSVPFLPWLPNEATALLVQLIRLGPMSREHLAFSLSMSKAELSALLLFLLNSGLITQKNIGLQETYQVAPHLEDALVGAFTKRHLFQEAAP